jgi:hypothetical protein
MLCMQMSMCYVYDAHVNKCAGKILTSIRVHHQKLCALKSSWEHDVVCDGYDEKFIHTRTYAHIHMYTEVVRMKSLWERGVACEQDEKSPESFWNCWIPTPAADKPFYGRPSKPQFACMAG